MYDDVNRYKVTKLVIVASNGQDGLAYQTALPFFPFIIVFVDSVIWLMVRLRSLDENGRINF